MRSGSSSGALPAEGMAVVIISIIRWGTGPRIPASRVLCGFIGFMRLIGMAKITPLAVADDNESDCSAIADLATPKTPIRHLGIEKKPTVFFPPSFFL